MPLRQTLALALLSVAAAHAQTPDRPAACEGRLPVFDTVPKTEFMDPASRGIQTGMSPYTKATATNIGNWPGFVSLRFVAPAGKKFDNGDGKTADILHWCGGALIGREWVLTAAHCVFDGRAGQALVAFDAASAAWTSTGQMESFGLPKGSRLEIVEKTDDLQAIAAPALRPRPAADAIVRHPDFFKPRDYANDIALIRIDPATPARGYLMKFSASRSVDAGTVKGRALLGAGYGLTDLADPLRRSTADSARVDAGTADYVTFAGAGGRTIFAGTPYLQEGVVRIWDDARCRAHRMRDPKPGETWAANEFCALGVGGAGAAERTRTVTDSCNTDSGGPLVQLDRDNCPVLNAIVSQGPSVCGQTDPGIYTRVSAHAAWIKSATRGATLMAVTDPTEVPPAGAVYSLAIAQAKVPSQGGLSLTILPPEPQPAGGVIQLKFATGPQGGVLNAFGFGPDRKLIRYSAQSSNFLDPRVYRTSEPGVTALDANGAAAFPGNPEKGFLLAGPAGTYRVLGYSYPTIALYEALKLEMRTRPRAAMVDQDYVDKIMPFLAPYKDLQLVQGAYEVTP